MKQLMNHAARNWTSTKDIKELAYRFICIMQAYDAFLAPEAEMPSRRDTGYSSYGIDENVEMLMSDIQPLKGSQSRTEGKHLHVTRVHSDNEIISTKF